MIVARHEVAALAGEEIEVCALVRLQHVVEVKFPVAALLLRGGCFPLRLPLKKNFLRNQEFELSLSDIELDRVAVLRQRQRSAGGGFRSNVQYHGTVSS